MSHEEKVVYDLINDKKEKYGKYHKCIFHLHTPASYDYKFLEFSEQNYNDFSEEQIIENAIKENVIVKNEQVEFLYNYDRNIFDSTKEYVTFLIIAKKLIKNNIGVVLIADHNTLTGFKKLKEAIRCVYNKTDKCYPEVILGVEINCADRNHVVGIFEEKSYAKIEEFLKNILIDNVSGTYYTSLQVISDIEKLNGYAYIAHINTSDILKPELFSGGYKNELFKQESLKILGTSNKNDIDTIKNKLTIVTKKCFNFVLDNDSHGIDTLTKNVFWIKGSKINFGLIKSMYKDYDITISLDEPIEPENYIKGIVIKNSPNGFLCSKEYLKDRKDEYVTIPFSHALNCIIGGRGSGKSTILNLIEFMLSQTVASVENLEAICLNDSVWILYKENTNEYIIKFSSPRKEYSDDNILKYFIENEKQTNVYKKKYFFRPERIKQCALKKYIEIYEVKKENNTININKYNKAKINILSKLFKSVYSINRLVTISFSDSELSDFVFNLIYKEKNNILKIN